MGSFGYGPWDSDGTESVLFDILNSKPEKIKNKLEKCLHPKYRYDYETARSMSYVVGKMYKSGLLKDKSLFNLAKSCYEKILADNEYLEEWTSKTKIKNALNKEYKLFL